MTALPPQQLAQGDAFWAALRAKFKLTSDYINLENGFYCFQPEPVLEAFIGHVRTLNFEASRSCARAGIPTSCASARAWPI